MAAGSPPADGLVGHLFRGTDSKASASDIVVTSDPGGEHVWVENVSEPHTPRRVLRRRLLSYSYEHLGTISAGIVDGEPWPPPPTFDGPGFAVWLRRWMDMEGISVGQLAPRAGVHPTLITTLRRGTPTKQALEKGQTSLHPSIETIAGIAHGLGYELAYVASKAGFADLGERFTPAEVRGLCALFDCQPSELDEQIAELAMSERSKERV